MNICIRVLAVLYNIDCYFHSCDVISINGLNAIKFSSSSQGIRGDEEGEVGC